MTLQEHYYAIKSGKGNKGQFLKQARNLFPEYFNQYTDFDTATNVLKSKQIISEAAGGVVSKGFDIFDWKKILAEEAKAEEKETSKEVLDDQKNAYNNSDMKNADNVNFNEIMKGFYAEMRDEKNAGKTGDEIKAMVVKNLAKDPLFYTKDGMFGTKGVGYTNEAPALGVPKEAKGKHKSSGYGDLKENILPENEVEEAKDKTGYWILMQGEFKPLVTEEQKLRSIIREIIKESLNEGSIEINGKIVRTYAQNGDTSYNVTYDDGTKDKIYVNNDGWDEINQLHRNAIGDDAYQKQFNKESLISEKLNYKSALNDFKKKWLDNPELKSKGIKYVKDAIQRAEGPTAKQDYSLLGMSGEDLKQYIEDLKQLMEKYS